jgi:Type II CAAX prenyl endopeptidase Rce1-like
VCGFASQTGLLQYLDSKALSATNIFAISTELTMARRSSVLCDASDGSTSPRLVYAFTYCLFASSCFVGSLYACVPSRIRWLDRNDPRQIRWRAAASSMACLVVSVLYPYVVCEPLIFPFFSGSTSLIDAMKHEASACGAVILHATLLYVGQIVHNAALTYAHLQHGRTGEPAGTAKLQEFLSLYFKIFLKPTISSFRGGPEAWCVWRNLILAPLSEEIVFRGCIVSALSASASVSIPSDSFHMSNALVIALAPLFFGVAHFHHALLGLQSGQRPVPVALQTMFQFTYTSLFGSYATYVFLQTRSLSAVVLCHSYCNAMGLPDLSFMWQRTSPLHTSRWPITVAHVIGLLSFASTFKVVYQYSK